MEVWTGKSHHSFLFSIEKCKTKSLGRLTHKCINVQQKVIKCMHGFSYILEPTCSCNTELKVLICIELHVSFHTRWCSSAMKWPCVDSVGQKRRHSEGKGLQRYSDTFVLKFETSSRLYEKHYLSSWWGALFVPFCPWVDYVINNTVLNNY